MYYCEDRGQLSTGEFFQSFGGRLRKDNRWVKLAEIMPWEYIEKVYIRNLSSFVPAAPDKADNSPRTAHTRGRYFRHKYTCPFLNPPL